MTNQEMTPLEDHELCNRCCNLAPRMAKALKAVEWAGGKYGTGCPLCFTGRYQHDPERHATDCELDAALKMGRGEQ